MIKSICCLILIAPFIFGCATSPNIPAFRDLNSSLIRIIESNRTISATTHFSSMIQDGLIIPYNQNRAGMVSGHSGYTMSKNILFSNMLNQYMIQKFPAKNAENKIEIYLTIMDFWIEEYSLNIFEQQRSSLSEMFVGSVVGEITYTLSANLTINVLLEYNDDIIDRMIFVSSDTTYNKITNNRTSTTNDINRFNETIQTIHGRNINLLINRALRELNKIFEEINI